MNKEWRQSAIWAWRNLAEDRGYEPDEIKVDLIILYNALKEAEEFIYDCCPAHGEYVLPIIRQALAQLPEKRQSQR